MEIMAEISNPIIARLSFITMDERVCVGYEDDFLLLDGLEDAFLLFAGLLIFDHITDAANRCDQSQLKGFLYFLTQVADVYVHSVGRSVKLISPDFL